jgi:hypothetical protein
MNHAMYMLLADLAVSAAATLLLEVLDLDLELVAEGARLLHQPVELGGISLGSCPVHVVQRPRVQVGNPRDIIVERSQNVLDGADLGHSRTSNPGPCAIWCER